MQLLWITILLIGFLARNSYGQDPVLYQCWDHLRIYPDNPNPLYYCSSNPDNFTNCPEKLYDSKHIYDLLFLKMINIKNLNNAFKYVCSKLDGKRKQSYPCFSELRTCFVSNMLNHSLNCMDGIMFCFYQKMGSCNPKDAIIFSKALTMIGNPSCTISNYNYNLRPFYGPEIHCYPQILQLPETAAVQLEPIYENFCAAFNKEKVSQCIETVLHNGRANNYDDDYTKEAFEFFRRRSDLCEYLSNSTHKECPDVDVVSCQKDLFGKVAYQQPFDVLLKSYSNCVYDKYKTCDTALAKIIKYNLDGIKSNLDGTKSNAAHPSISFVLILSQIGIIFSLFF